VSTVDAAWSLSPLPPTAEASAPPANWRSYVRVTTVLFAMVHLAAILGAIWFWSWRGVALALGAYFVRMVVVTAAYHRYFSHRSFKTSRAFQFVLAVAARQPAKEG
jgi:stearoyl-CoA desaturase (delta-9 desaturase)